MTEDPLSAEAEASICPWCSATYTGEPETCPSCGAGLTTDPTADPSVPGLTAIDAAAIVRAKTPPTRQRNRILSWISGEYPDELGSVADAGALAPPDQAVRREILRLELEAEVANLQAEADALLAEATVEGHAPGVSAEDAAAAEAVVERIEEVSAELHEVEEELEAAPVATATELAADEAEPAVSEPASAPPPPTVSEASDEASPPA